MHLDVWIAAPESDSHAHIVADDLQTSGVSVACIPLGEVPRWNLTWRSGSSALLTRGSTVFTVDSSTAVWWRRPDAGDLEIADPDERALAYDEIRALVPGVLEAVGVRWVDAPWTLLRARQKCVQLAAARDCGAHIPDFAVCGDPAAGRRFASGRRIVAKAVSTGVGLAPFVAEVPREVLGDLSSCPTMLQELVPAIADLRVVTVGTQALGWSRPRTPQTLDWRRDDPAGTQFELVANDPTSGLAAAVADRLGLTFSVQDWLVDEAGLLTFLEVNPQGQWLFLPGAGEVASPSLASLLRGEA